MQHISEKRGAPKSKLIVGHPVVVLVGLQLIQTKSHSCAKITLVKNNLARVGKISYIKMDSFRQP